MGKLPEKLFCINHYCSIIAAITGLLVQAHEDE
jgi:hypothetical protein